MDTTDTTTKMKLNSLRRGRPATFRFRNTVVASVGVMSVGLLLLLVATLTARRSAQEVGLAKSLSSLPSCMNQPISKMMLSPKIMQQKRPRRAHQAHQAHQAHKQHYQQYPQPASTSFSSLSGSSARADTIRSVVQQQQQQQQPGSSSRSLSRTSSSASGIASGIASIPRSASFSPSCMEGHGRIVILGGGSFGASVAIAVANRGHNVTLLVRKQPLVDDINQRRRHPRFKDVILDERIKATNEPEQAFKPSQDGQPVDLIIHAVPVQVSREYLLSIRDHIPDGVPVLSCSKGIELKTNFFMHDLLNETLTNQRTGNPPKLAFMSGLDL